MTLSSNINAGISKNETAFDTIFENLFYHPSEALDQLNALRCSCTSKENSNYKSYFDVLTALSAYKEGQYTLALAKADSALSYFLWNENHEWQARSILVLAFTAEALGLDSEALEYYQVASLTLSDSALKGFSFLGVARCNKRLGKEWQHYLNKGVNSLIFTQKVEHVLYAKSIPFWFDKTLPNMTEELENIASEYTRLGMWIQLSSTYKLISQYYLSIEEYYLALRYNARSLNALSNEGSNICLYQASIYSLDGAIYTKLELFDEAKDRYDEAVESYKSGKITVRLYYPYKKLNAIYTELEDFENANQFAQKALDSYARMYNIKKSSAAQLAEVLLNREYIESRLRYIKQRQRIKQILVIVFSIISILIIGLFFFSKKKYYLHFINKLKKDNEVLFFEKKELIILIERIENDVNVDKTMSKLKQIVMEDQELSTTLPGSFYNNYHRYVVKFKMLYPTLSESEIRSAVMFAMNIPNCTIAQLMCIQPDSVKKYRNRLRRKIKIDSATNLNQYLKTVVNEITA